MQLPIPIWQPEHVAFGPDPFGGGPDGGEPVFEGRKDIHDIDFGHQFVQPAWHPRPGESRLDVVPAGIDAALAVEGGIIPPPSARAAPIPERTAGGFRPWCVRYKI